MKNTWMSTAAAAIGLALSLGAEAAPTPILTNGSFETGTLAGWTLSSGSTTVRSDYGATDGTFAAILGFGDAFGPNFSLFQTFSTVAGQTYDVAFDWAAAPNATPAQTLSFYVQCAVGSLCTLVSDTLTGTGALPAPFTHHAYRFVADGAFASIHFLDFSASSFRQDQVLDNVSVSLVSPTVSIPEPATLSLLGLAVVPLLRKRVRKTSPGLA